jgi:hypothetical protein
MVATGAAWHGEIGRTQVERLIFGEAIAARRSVLQSHFDVCRQFEEIEESCIPSYVHGNRSAAWVA